MKASKIAHVNDYIAGFPEPVRLKLEQLRMLIQKAAPNAEEGISYGMPAYKTMGKPLVYFAGFSGHIGFYATPVTHEAFQKELLKYKTGKGSVQFPLELPLPVNLITKMVRFKVKRNLEKGK